MPLPHPSCPFHHLHTPAIHLPHAQAQVDAVLWVRYLPNMRQVSTMQQVKADIPGSSATGVKGCVDGGGALLINPL